jgi:hypothetical protein
MKRRYDICGAFALIISLTASLGLAQSGWSNLDEDLDSGRSAIVLDIVNSPDARSDLRNLQQHLTDVGVHLESHSKLIKLARRLKLRSEETDEPEVLRMLAKRLRVDYFIILDYVDETELKVSLISGNTGQEDWTKRFGLPNGYLQDRHWYALATQVSRQMTPPSMPRNEMNFEGNEQTHPSSDLPTFSIHAGALAINRAFAASGVQSLDNPLTGGIEYDLGFVPGFTLDGEVTPLSNVPNLGLGIGYDRAFFRTKQTTVVPVASSGTETTSETVKLLESSYSQLYVKLFYRNALASGIELSGGLKTRLVSFAITGDSEYRGVNYLTLDFELASFLPIYKRSLGLCLSGAVAPVVSFGDSLQELGNTHSTIAVSAAGGLAFRFESGFSLKGFFDYSNFSSEIKGSGRDGRMIDRALDQYMTLKFLGGYVY